MSSPTSPAENADDQQLVAYLDGELPAEETAELEDRLSSDPQLRQRLHDLQRAWDLLDDLPRNEATDAFTKSTIEMVLTRATLELARARGRRRAWLVRLSVCGLLLAISAAGSFAAVSWVRGAPNRQLVRELPYIENIDLYQKVKYDLEFLRRLKEEELFNTELPDVQP